MLFRLSSFKGSFIDVPLANFSISEQQLSTAQGSWTCGLQRQTSVLEAPANTRAATEVALWELAGSPELAMSTLQTGRGHASVSPRAGGSETLWGQLNVGSMTQQGSFRPWCFLAEG